jgi:hypothetical protein
VTIELSDISYKKSKIITDTDLNGGRMGNVSVVSGAKHSLFPRVTKTERINGVTRFRKEFWKNSNADDDFAYGLLQWIEVPSNAGDRFYMKKGTQTDTQSSLTSPASGDVPLWMGAGQLAVALAGSETSVSITMESDDFVFENGGYLHIADKVQASQTVASDVNVGDSVTFGTEWTKITSTTDIEYPNGVYLGNNNVLSIMSGTSEEWLAIAELLTSDESIGTGDDTASPSLSALTVTNGVCQVEGKLPVITTYTSLDVALTLYINADGTVDTTQGNGVSGELNMETGVWTTNPTFDTAVGSGKDILATYRDRPFSYSGNVATVQLDDQVSNAYTVAMTRCGGCVYDEEIGSSVSDETVTTAGDGDYDFATYPIVPHNEGAENDIITITFTSASTFNVTGVNLGSIGTGSVSSSMTALNPDTSEDLFTISNSGFSGTWASGDTIVFTLSPSSSPIWLKEIVPAGTAQEPHNLCVLGYYLE